MAEQVGKIITCDRCGKSEFLEFLGEETTDGGFTTWLKFRGLPEGWDYEPFALLCDKCKREWIQTKNEFMTSNKEVP